MSTGRTNIGKNQTKNGRHGQGDKRWQKLLLVGGIMSVQGTNVGIFAEMLASAGVTNVGINQTKNCRDMARGD